MKGRKPLSNEERIRRHKYSEKERSYRYHHTEKGREARRRANKKYHEKMKLLRIFPFFNVPDFNNFL